MPIKSNPLAPDAYREDTASLALDLRLALHRGWFKPEADGCADKLHAALDQFLVTQGEKSTRKGRGNAAQPQPTLTEQQIVRLWADTACIPNLDDRVHSLTSSVFMRLGLDWRNPSHVEHVAKLTAHVMPTIPADFKRMTND